MSYSDILRSRTARMNDAADLIDNIAQGIGVASTFSAFSGNFTFHATTGGNITFQKAGTGIRIATGANARLGHTTLVAGTKTVNISNIANTSSVFLTRSTTGGTPGHLSYTISAGVSFTINSSSASDTSTIIYMVVEEA